jgi:hypothetical protein
VHHFCIEFGTGEVNFGQIVMAFEAVEDETSMRSSRFALFGTHLEHLFFEAMDVPDRQEPIGEQAYLIGAGWDVGLIVCPE